MTETINLNVYRMWKSSQKNREEIKEEIAPTMSKVEQIIEETKESVRVSRLSDPRNGMGWIGNIPLDEVFLHIKRLREKYSEIALLKYKGNRGRNEKTRLPHYSVWVRK